MVRNKHLDGKELAIPLASIDALSIDYVSSTGLGSRGPSQINKMWSVPQEACGGHKLPPRKNVSHLLGMPSAERLQRSATQGITSTAETCLAQGHSLPRQPHSMTGHCMS